MAEAIRTPIVNYAQIAEAFPTTEARTAELPNLADDLPPAEQVTVHAALARAQFLLRTEQTDPDVMCAPNDEFTARLQSALAAKAVDEQELRELGAGGYEIAFDHSRLEIVRWVYHIAKSWVLSRGHIHSFWKMGSTETVEGDLRLALFSDWGSGRYGAPHISESIKNDERPFTYIIHLGDTYYSGTNEEEQQNVLDLWPARKEAKSRALNGNHDMYSGGTGYFDLVLHNFEQSSSAFAIQNPHWLIVGLDTAYNECDLQQEQPRWLEDLVSAAGDRKVVLLTHHQCFSNTSEQGVGIQHRLADLLTSGKIFAWYWGHEHLCAIYDRHPLWGLHGRCIGHGGIPDIRHHVAKGAKPKKSLNNNMALFELPGLYPNPRCLLLDGPNVWIPGHEQQYGPHGYMTVELRGPELIESLRDADGTELWSNTLTA